MAKHGIPTPDGGRMKISFCDFDIALKIAALIKNKKRLNPNIAFKTSDSCDYCEEPVKVHLSNGEDSTETNLCIDCYNKLMAELTGSEVPDNMPKRLSFKNNDGGICEFEIELMIFANCKTLTATEIGDTKRKADVFGELDDDVNDMFKELRERIVKMLSTAYIDSEGYFIGSKAVGYIEYNHERKSCDIIIDGKPYTWAELE